MIFNFLGKAKWAVLVVFSAACAAVTPVSAGDREDALNILDSSVATLNNFLVDPQMAWVRENLPKARGVMIVPKMVKAGFVLGGSGGQGALVARDKETGEWLGPVFYTMGAASIGLQAGLDISETMLLVMTDAGVDALMANTAKLGGDARVAAGPVGGGVAASSADVYGFSRSKGLFAGVSFDGSVVAPSGKLNSALYAQPVTPVDILIRKSVTSADGEPLVRAVTDAAQGNLY